MGNEIKQHAGSIVAIWACFSETQDSGKFSYPSPQKVPTIVFPLYQVHLGNLSSSKELSNNSTKFRGWGKQLLPVGIISFGYKYMQSKTIDIKTINDKQ